MITVREALAATVLSYLRAAEARDLATASSLLAPRAMIVFPGDVRHEDLAAVVTAARDRYRRVSKSFDTIDVDADRATVVVTGRLSGENLYGVQFANVRYVDRFRLLDGLISEQHVWNDLEESQALTARTPAELLPALRP
jgi:hypothetical protein